MTQAADRARERLLSAWLRANPNQPMKEGMDEVRVALEAIEAEVRGGTDYGNGHHPDCPANHGEPCPDSVCGANGVRMLLEDIIIGRTTLAAATEGKTR